MNLIVFVLDTVVVFGYFPNQKKGLSDVFVRWATVPVHSFVYDWTDLIYELEDVLLQDLVDLGELSDVAKSKYSAFFLTLEHRIHVAFLDDILTDDLSSGASEDNTQQSSNFDNGITDDGSFIKSIRIDFLLRSSLRIFSHFLQLLHHFFNRLNDHFLDVLVKEVKQTDKQKADKECPSQRQIALIGSVRILIEHA